MGARSTQSVGPKIHLSCLGSVDLVGLDGSPIRGVLVQPKRVALLTAVALFNHGGFVPRDRLLELLWPELDMERARNALNQALHRLRGGLGQGVLEARGRHEIRLNALRFWCDALAFREAIEADEVEEAVELSRGPLLEGLHLTDSPSFDRWQEQQRRYFERGFVGAARKAASRAADRGDLAGSLAYAAIAVERAPYDELAVRQLMECHLDMGNRSGALRAYEALGTRLRGDLEIEPSAETQALAEGIKSQEWGSGARTVDPPGGSSQATDSVPVSTAEAVDDLARPHVTSSADVSPIPVRARRRWRLVAVGVGLLVAVLSAALVEKSRVNDAASSWVAVAPFENWTADAAFAGIGDYVGDVIHQGLVSAGHDVVITPESLQLLSESLDSTGQSAGRSAAVKAAEEAGARFVVLGTIDKRGGEVVVRADLVEAATGLAQESLGPWVWEPGGSDETLIEIRSRVLGAVSLHTSAEFVDLVALESRPPTQEAYLAFRAGRRLHHESRWRDELAAYQRATALDPEFVQAKIMTMVAYGNIAMSTPESAKELHEKGDSIAQDLLP